LRDFPKGKINVNVEHGVAVLRGELDGPDQIQKLVFQVAELEGTRLTVVAGQREDGALPRHRDGVDGEVADMP
jgi:hypothetical protein